MSFQPAENRVENAFQVDPFGNRVGDLVEEADAGELLVQVAFGPLAQDRVSNGTFEQLRVELAFNQIVRRTGAHGFAVNLVISQAGQQNDRRPTTAGDGSPQ